MIGKEPEYTRSKIWKEQAELDDPYTAHACYCAGYDIYNDLLLNDISWIEYLYLMFRHELPHGKQAKLLEGLAVAVANLGPRDPSVRAAMNACIGGSSSASALMAALAVGGGQYGGAREVYQVIETLHRHGRNLSAWENVLKNPRRTEQPNIWPESEYPPGFNPHGVSCPTPVKLTLNYFASLCSGGALEWLKVNRTVLESYASCPLAMTGVAAAALVDLGVNAREGEMLYLLLRLPGAAAHALEQHMQWMEYPFAYEQKQAITEN